MFGDDAEVIVRKCLDMARGGNEVALRLVIERLLPPRKSIPFTLRLPKKLSTASDIASALDGVITQMSEGKIAPDEALHAAGLLGAKRQAIETIELESRLSKIEERLLGGPK
jgi:hypothetical protein